MDRDVIRGGKKKEHVNGQRFVEGGTLWEEEPRKKGSNQKNKVDVGKATRKRQPWVGRQA